MLTGSALLWPILQLYYLPILCGRCARKRGEVRRVNTGLAFRFSKVHQKSSERTAGTPRRGGSCGDKSTCFEVAESVEGPGNRSWVSLEC